MMDGFLSAAFLLAIITFVGSEDFQAEVVDATDRDLNVAILESEYVLALLYIGDCEEKLCKAAQATIDTVAKQSYVNGLKILRIRDSEEALKYKLKAFPALMFYRRAVPVLYDSVVFEAETVVVWLEQNKESSVQELTDDNFEHLTQATSGATTGDWFIMFSNSACSEYTPLWQGVAKRLKYKLNTATVDTGLHAETVKRLNIQKCPTILLLRQGFMYEYTAEITTITSLVNFATDNYVDTEAQSIPLEPSALDNLGPKLDKLVKATLSALTNLYLVSMVLLIIVIYLAWKKKRADKTAKTA